MKTENIKYHLSDYKYAYIIALLVLFMISCVIYYEYKYPCVYGHYEEQWKNNYITNGNGNMTYAGGYFVDVFVCDCTVRDSIKK